MPGLGWKITRSRSRLHTNSDALARDDRIAEHAGEAPDEEVGWERQDSRGTCPSSLISKLKLQRSGSRRTSSGGVTIPQSGLTYRASFPPRVT